MGFCIGWKSFFFYGMRLRGITCFSQQNHLWEDILAAKFFCFLKIRFVRPKALWLKISRPPVCDRLFTCCIWTTGKYVSTGDTFTHLGIFSPSRDQNKRVRKSLPESGRLPVPQYPYPHFEIRQIFCHLPLRLFLYGRSKLSQQHIWGYYHKISEYPV